eukprot:23927_6
MVTYNLGPSSLTAHSLTKRKTVPIVHVHHSGQLRVLSPGVQRKRYPRACRARYPRCQPNSKQLPISISSRQRNTKCHNIRLS